MSRFVHMGGVISVGAPDSFAIMQELLGRPPYDRMSVDHVKWMSERMSVEGFEAGAPIFVPGQMPEKFYFIRQGAIQIEAIQNISPDTKILAEVHPGDSFPVEALHERRPLFSTFRAKTPTECYTMPAEAFIELEGLSSVFKDFCQHRSDGFLASTKKIYHAHFAPKGSEQFTLDSPLSLLVRSTPLAFGPDVAIRTVLARMDAQAETVIVVINTQSEPLGIFTIEALLHNIAGGALDTDAPISSVMLPSPPMLSPNNFGHEAALEMAMHGYKQILVVDGRELKGVITERELFSLQRVGLSEISNAIRSATSTDVLIHAAKDIELLAYSMLAQGVSSEQLTRIISTLNDHLTERIIHLEFEAAGIDPASCCWIALGSEGRFEQTFCTDQDNGLIFHHEGGADELRERLLPVARKINEILARCGFPLCKGNIMAGNPQWCLSLDEWKRKFSEWIDEPVPEALLNATIFFDFRFIYGASALADELQSWLAGAASKNKRFIHLMVDGALQRSAPIGFFKNFVLDKNGEHPNTIDLKLSGIALFVDAARIYSLANGLKHTNTANRLRAAASASKIERADAEAWVDAFYFIQTLRLRQQLEQNINGEALHNCVNPYGLNELDRRILMESLKQAAKMQKSVSSSYGLKGM